MYHYQILDVIDKDRQLSFFEFRAWKCLGARTLDQRMAVFARADKNRDRFLNEQEFYSAWSEVVTTQTDEGYRPLGTNAHGDGRNGEPVTYAVDNVDEEPVSRGRSESAGAKQYPLPAVTVARAFDAVHADAVHADAVHADAANIGDEALQPTPKGLLANLAELLGFLWNLLTLGVGG